MALKDLIALTKKRLEKKKPDSETDVVIASEAKPVIGLTINNPLFEYILDRRFLPYGRFYLSYGKKGSAKTSMFYELAKTFQRANGDVIWLEMENAADLEYAAKQGVDLDKLVLVQPTSLEEALLWAEEFIRNMPKAYPDGDTPVLICLDSIAGSATEYELDQSHTIQDIMPGTHARILSRWYRELEKPLANEKCIFLALNQLKTKIGAMGYGEDAQDSMMGGEAPLFSSTYQWKMKKKEELVAEDENGAPRKIGSRHIIQCKRNKLGREGKGQEIEVDLYINGGVDWWSPLVRKLGKEYSSLMRKSGAYYYWLVEGVKYTDLDGAVKVIDTTQAYRETDMAVILSQSPEAHELIRKAFGIPELPAEEEVQEVEKERKQKRTKKKQTLTDEDDVKVKAVPTE